VVLQGQTRASESERIGGRHNIQISRVAQDPKRFMVRRIVGAGDL
jgi:hypothetical protein